MSLSSAINTAQSILSNTSTQTSIVSKNLSNAANPNYVRRSADMATNGWGADIVNISRAANDVLFRDNVRNIGAASGQSALLDGIDQIRALLGGDEYERAPSTLIGNFQNAVQLFAAQPSNASAAQGAISEAIILADGIRETSTAVQKQRLEADAEIGRQVERLNGLLADFETANNNVKKATQAGGDPSDALDQRERLLGEISKIVGVTAITRADNDVSLYTTSGTTLFETIPRDVTFVRTNGFDATISGNSVLVDGVPIKAGQGGETTARGSLAALMQVRDDVAPTYQNQLDEIARTLVSVFAESDQVGGGPDLPGLFTWDGGVVPAPGVLEPGVALSLRVNAAYTGTAENALKLRDGGVNGVNYTVNTTGAAGFVDRLNSLLGKLEAPIDFDPAAGIGTRAKLMDFAATSTGWLESLRQQADRSAEAKGAAQYRSQEALSNTSGVNIDEEMAKLLELEQSYKASAKLMSTIDEMINSLLMSVR